MLTRRPTLDVCGITSRASSSALAVNPLRVNSIPVTLPPGRASLAARPLPMGSVSMADVIGTAVVACLAASAEEVLVVTMTSGLLDQFHR
jgi:hypothetical protein